MADPRTANIATATAGQLLAAVVELVLNAMRMLWGAAQPTATGPRICLLAMRFYIQ